jgi:hypothetical protein
VIFKRKEFELPEPGLHDAEIIEVTDRGMVQTKFGAQAQSGVQIPPEPERLQR